MAVNLIGPDGRPYVMDDPANLAKAIELGYREVTPEAPRTSLEAIRAGAGDVGGAIQAGAAGALQGFAPGLVGAALAAPTEETPTEAKVRKADISELAGFKEKSPMASGVGEFVGMMASPVNKVAAPIEAGIGATSALGRIGAKVVSNAPVGALFGAGSAMDDSAIGDQDLTAEKLLSGVGLGAALGSAGGLFGGALEEGVAVVAPKLGKTLEGAQESLLKFRDMFGMSAAGAMGKDFKAAAYRENTRDLVDMLIDKGVMKAGQKIDDVADAAVKLASETGKAQGDLAKAIEAKGVTVSGEKVADKIEALASRYETGNVGDKNIAKRLGSEAEAIRARGDMPFTVAEEGKRGFDKYLEFGAEQSPVQEGLKQARGILNKEIESAASAAPESAAWLKAKKEMGLLAQVRDFSVARAEALKAHRFLSLSDHLVGGAGGVMGAVAGGDEHRMEGAMTGIAMGYGNKILRQRMPSIIAKLSDSIARSPQLGVIAASFVKNFKAAAPMMGQYAQPIINAAGQSAAHALATHMTMAQVDPGYSEAAKIAGFQPESPGQHGHALEKAHGLATIAAATQAHDAATDGNIEKILKGERGPVVASNSQDFGAKRMRKDGASAHQQRIDDVRKLAADPSLLIDRVTANLGRVGELAPGVSAAMMRTTHAAVMYLSKMAQEPPSAGPLAPKWVHSEAEQHAFSSVLAVIQDPENISKHAAAGTLTEAQMNAYRAVYPKASQELSDKLLSRMTENPKGVPYRARLMIGLITGTDPDGSLGALSRNQVAIMRQPQKEGEGGSPGPSSSAKTPLTLAQRMATPQQKSAMKEA